MAARPQTVTKLHFERATGVVGAWVRGFDPDDPDNNSRADELLRALSQYGVLFFDFGRVPGDEEYTRFAGLFGNVQGEFDQRVKERDRNAPPLIDS